MPKRSPEDVSSAAPVRVEVVPRRGLSRQEAARYVGISTTEFDELVREGDMPQPFRIGSRTIWDLRKLDAAFDILSGSEETDSFDNWGTPPKTMQQAIAEFDRDLEEHAARRDARRRARSQTPPSVEYPGHPNVYTPDTLADYWRCSASHVRKLIRRGELMALRPSPKLLRITPAAVIAFEKANAVTPKT